MEDTLVGPEVAKLAKQKGFNEKCEYYYYFKYKGRHTPDELVLRKFENCNLKDSGNGVAPPNEDDEYSAPTQSLLQKWLREKHNIDVYCIPCETQLGDITLWKSNDTFVGKYEEALEVGLIEALKLIKLCKNN